MPKVAPRLLGDKRSLFSHDSHPDFQELLNLLDAALDDFNGIHTSLDEVSRQFADYKSSGAAFLEEFLAPEGIITRKRDLDEKITSSSERTRERKEQLGALGEEKVSLSEKLAGARKSLEEFRVAQARTTTQVAAAEDALNALTREEESQQNRLDEIRQLMAADQARIKSLEDQWRSLFPSGKNLKRNRTRCERNWEGWKTGITHENEKMAGKESN